MRTKKKEAEANRTPEKETKPMSQGKKKEIYKIRGTNNGSRGALSLSALIIDSRMFNKVKY